MTSRSSTRSWTPGETRRARAATGATATASASSSPASAPSTSGSRSYARQLLPRGPRRAVLACGPRGHRRCVRDGGRRRAHQEGEARAIGREHRPHERQPGVEDTLVAGRSGRRPAGARLARRHPPLPGRHMAALHRAPDAQRRRQRADQAEKGRRAGHPEGRVRRARPRAREGVPPTRNRPDRGLLPQGGGGAGRCRGRRCPTWISPTSTTSGGTSTTCGIAPTASQAPQPRRAGLPSRRSLIKMMGAIFSEMDEG